MVPEDGFIQTALARAGEDGPGETYVEGQGLFEDLGINAARAVMLRWKFVADVFVFTTIASLLHVFLAYSLGLVQEVNRVFMVLVKSSSFAVEVASGREDSNILILSSVRFVEFSGEVSHRCHPSPYSYSGLALATQVIDEGSNRYPWR